MQVRAAIPEEAEIITAVAHRSKAYWGYSAEFMEIAKSDLIISVEYIAANLVFVIETDNNISGFYSLLPKNEQVIELNHLFVLPEAISKGYGKVLWEHAVVTARQAGFKQMLIEADPNAEPFYHRMGAIRIGERVSIVPGRMLPLLEFRLEITKAAPPLDG